MLKKTLIVAVCYLTVAKLSLFLAIPPGYATPVWPAAGFALGFLLWWGEGVWVGVLLGSFFSNLWTSLDLTTSTTFLWSVLPPLGIALGAALQTVVGYFLIRSSVKKMESLSEDQGVIAIILLGGFVACVVSPTCGVSVLWLLHKISTEDYFYSWWTWWVGDAIGVVLVAPIMLMFKGKASKRHILFIFLPFLLMVTLFVSLFLWTRHWDQKQLDLQFQIRVDRIQQAIKEKLTDNLESLYSIESFYSASQEVERDEFHDFVSHILARHPGVHALSFNRYVREVERLPFEKKIREKEGISSFSIKQEDRQGSFVTVPNKSEYVVVDYIEPFLANKLAFGFDLLSDPEKADSLWRACDDNKMIATPPVHLIQEEKGNQVGLLVFLPIYKNKSLIDTVEDRREHLLGFATGIFNLKTMLKSFLSGLDKEGIKITVDDITDPSSHFLIYNDDLLMDQSPKSIFQKLATIEVAGRSWLLAYDLLSTYQASHRSWVSWIVLTGGLLFTGLLGGFLLIFVGRTTRVEELVEERTHELEEMNKKLQTQFVETHQAEEKLRIKVEEMERLNKVMFGREERILELKEELKKTRGGT